MRPHSAMTRRGPAWTCAVLLRLHPSTARASTAHSHHVHLGTGRLRLALALIVAVVIVVAAEERLDDIVVHPGRRP